MGTWVIVGLVIAFQIWKASRSAGKDSQQGGNVSPPRTSVPGPVIDADKRYAEIQEEIRRRISQRTAGGAAQTPNAPVAKPVLVPNVQRTASATRPVPIQPPLAPQRKSVPVPPPVVVAPVPAFPRAAEAQLISTPATYNTKSDWQGEAEWMSVAIGGQSKSEIAVTTFMNTLRASLASPSAARQAFMLKEILGEPVGFRRAGSGGHEGWV